jgi:anti-sigma regulatory factor (Ser/Thr protein kinase)
VQYAKRCCSSSPEIIDAVALAVSEAVGNAVRHAYRDHTGTVNSAPRAMTNRCL